MLKKTTVLHRTKAIGLHNPIKERLTMRTVVYPNTTNFVTSDTQEHSVSATEKYPFLLSDAERIKITQIFLRKLLLCCLTQRSAKIVTTICKYSANPFPTHCYSS